MNIYKVSRVILTTAFILIYKILVVEAASKYGFAIIIEILLALHTTYTLKRNEEGTYVQGRHIELAL